MEQQTDSQVVQVGKLSQSTYANWQEFADDLASKLVIPTQPGPEGASGTSGSSIKGEKGDPGSSVTKDVKICTPTAGVTFYDHTESLNDKTVNLITNGGAPTVTITGFSNTRVFFSGAWPAGYVLNVIDYIITE